MAHPHLVVDLAVRHILHMWHTGLQPSLTFNTYLNGAIAVSSTLTYSPPPLVQPYVPQDFTPGKTTIKRKSGRLSRFRRRSRRFQKHQQFSLNKSTSYFKNEEYDTEQISPTDLFISTQDELLIQSEAELTDEIEFGDSVKTILSALQCFRKVCYLGQNSSRMVLRQCAFVIL